jgi:Protein of unknown function (DUF2637)
MTAPNASVQRSHRKAVRFFWGLLIAATAVSLLGNIAHAVLPYLPRIVVEIVAAAVPPIALLAAVHGIALAVRAGASGRVYCWAVSAVAAIGVGAFAVSFLALCDLMRGIGYGDTTAWIFPAIIDTTVAVSTLMLVALGDKPARRTRTMTTPADIQTSLVERLTRRATQPVRAEATSLAPNTRARAVQPERGQNSASAKPVPVQSLQHSAQPLATQVDADLASELIASGVTTQPVETVIAVLASSRGGASINAAAKASGINYRTAQRIVAAAAEHRERQLAAVG